MIDIEFANILNRCEMLSSFDGREALTQSGESNYKQLRITSQETDLLKTYIGQAVNNIESKLGGAIESVSSTDNADKVSFAFASDSSRRSGNSSVFKRCLLETIVAFVMKRWYEDKASDRSNAYHALYEDMLISAKNIAYKKTKPTLDAE